MTEETDPMDDTPPPEGMREIESVSHEHEYGPWAERGTEVVFLTRFYLQSRQCLDPRCRWTQHARSAAGSTNPAVATPERAG